MIILRVYKGVREHFPIRVSEWVMVWPALWMWLILRLNPDLFSSSPSFSTLASWGDERTWSIVMGGCGICRVIALKVNGTFRGFAFSSHIRAGRRSARSPGFSIASDSSWALSNGALVGALWGAAGWSTMVVIEIFNTHRSWSDIGKHRQGQH